jgi:hypothetical protein
MTDLPDYLADIQPGRWVKITARVVDLHPNGDLGVELPAHAGFACIYVSRDRCELAAVPDGVEAIHDA